MDLYMTWPAVRNAVLSTAWLCGYAYLFHPGPATSHAEACTEIIFSDDILLVKSLLEAQDKCG